MAKASDNLFPYVHLVPAAAPAAPAAGAERVYLDSADGKLKRKNSAGTVATIEGTSGGGTVTSATASGTGSGDLTQTSVVMTDLLTVTIAATAGQKLLCTFTASVFNNTVGDLVDVSINVGGTDRVLNACVCGVALAAVPISAQILYTVVSGDISGGNVTVKVRWRTSAHSGFMLNSSNRVPQLTVLNVG